MKTAALEAELRRALTNLAHEHMVELVGAGVPIYPIVVYQLIGAELISFTGDECYCPDRRQARVHYADSGAVSGDGADE
jgi:hypothetical protein